MDEFGKRREPGISCKAILIGFILATFNSYWAVRRGIMWNGPPDIMSLHYNSVFTVFSLTIINLLFLKKYAKNVALTQRDLMVIYVMISLVTAIGGFDRIQTILVLLGQIYWFSTPENEWQEIFSPYMPKWLSVTDKKALGDYYGDGDTTLYLAGYLKAWLTPVLIWCSFLIVIIFVMLCINVIMRRQWIERERLTYPIIQIPVAMTENGGAKAFFANKAFWIAFAIAAFVNIINTLALIFPVVPRLPTRGIHLYIPGKPWNAMGNTFIDLTPFAFAFGFLMPLNLNFSLWFLFLFWKFGRVLLSVFGSQWQLTGTYMPYAYEQVSGGCIGLAIIALWKSRRHLAEVMGGIFANQNRGDSSEPISYRAAFLGIITGSAFLVLFFYKTGMPVWVAVLFLAIHFMIAVAITKMRAELGPPFHELLHSGADRVLLSTFGSMKLGKAALTMFVPLSGITDRQRAHTMPHQLEGFKIAEQTGIRGRGMFLVMIASSAVGAFVSSWLILHSTYRYGTVQAGGFGRWAIVPIKNLIINPVPPDRPGTIAMGYALVLTMFFSFMRRFLWWPIHPLAYPLSLVDWGIRRMWFPIMVSWVIKRTILKYGGAKLYRRAIPVFSGLLLGEFVVGGFLTILNITFDVPVYMFGLP